jgi:small subunit ribosomal protein S6
MVSEMTLPMTAASRGRSTIRPLSSWEGRFAHGSKFRRDPVHSRPKSTERHMTNRYEAVFILTPVLSEDQTKEAVKKFKDLIQSGDGKIHHEESWGMRKLAYPIQKKSTGFYHLIEFESEPTLVAKLETEYRRDERVIRFLTIVMDKHHVGFAEKRRHKQLSKKTIEPSNA